MADRTPAPDTPELRAHWEAALLILTRSVLACMGMAALAGTQPASATSIAAIPPHDPGQACLWIADSVERMIGKAPMDTLQLFYTDQFGHVGYDERAAFIASMTASDGKPDRSPLTVTMVWPVGKSKPGDKRVLYLVGVQRDQWHNEREGSFDPMVLEPEGYELTTGYWLFEFSGNSVRAVREGGSYFDFIDYDVRLEGCGNG